MVTVLQTAPTTFATDSRAQGLVLLAFRLCLVPLFYYSGVGKLLNFTATAARLPGGGNALSLALTAGAIGVEVGVSTLFLVGLFARGSAAVLILFTAAATLMFHNFWAAPDAQVVAQTVNFLKNLGLIGGLLMIAAFGAGPYALQAGNRR